MDSANKLTHTLRASVDRLDTIPTPHTPYILAVSGGKDSMALMHIFAQVYGSASGRVVTIDHGIRPESAQEVIGVQREAHALGYEVDIVSLSISSDTPSLEAHARAQRYEALERRRIESGASYIITAHHREDQVETVLMRLFAGSSIAGLSGMDEVSGYVFRPWLSLDPLTISRYVDDRGIVYFDDPSNADTRFRRNALRHEILPFLRESMPHISETIMAL